MRKTIRLTENDLVRIVRRVINEDITSEKLEKVKSEMPQFTYRVLKMRHVDNLSIKNIAKEVQSSESVVRSRLKKGAEQVNRILDLKDKESRVTDEDRKKIADEMKKQKIDLFTTKLITMVDHFSETLTQDEINKVLRKLIK